MGNFIMTVIGGILSIIFILALCFAGCSFITGWESPLMLAGELLDFVGGCVFLVCCWLALPTILLAIFFGSIRKD